LVEWVVSVGSFAEIDCLSVGHSEAESPRTSALTVLLASSMPRSVQELVRVNYTLTAPGVGRRVVQTGHWMVRQAAISAHHPSFGTPETGLGIFEWEGRRHVIRRWQRQAGVNTYDVEGVFVPVPTEGNVTLELTDADGRSTSSTVDASVLFLRDGQLFAQAGGYGEVAVVYYNGVFYGSV
jgi:hypothetical protein